MTVLGALARRSIQNPAVPLTSANLTEWLSGPPSAAGQHVTETKALGIIAYYRAIVLLAGTMATLPLHVYRKGTRERVHQATVLDNPNGVQTPVEFWMTQYANALSWGNAYASISRDRADIVRRAWPLHPSKVKPHVEVDRELGPVKRFEVTGENGQVAHLTARDVAHTPFLSIDGVAGLSPLKLARQSLGIAMAAEQFAGRWFANGTHLSGVLTTDQKLDPDAAKRLKAQWRELYGGVGNAHDIGILDSGSKFLPLSIPPEDAELLASRKFSVSEVARLFGVPPHMIGDVERSTSWGTGIEQQTIGMVVFTLRPWLTVVEQRVTRELLPGGWTSGVWHAEYALEGLLRGDSATRAAFYASAIQNGWMTRNEVRDLENRVAAEGLDEFLAPSNLTLVQVNGELVPLAGAGQPTGGGADAATED